MFEYKGNLGTKWANLMLIYLYISKIILKIQEDSLEEKLNIYPVFLRLHLWFFDHWFFDRNYMEFMINDHTDIIQLEINCPKLK